MASPAELMAAGLPALLAQMLGQVVETSISAAGTTQGTATAIKGNLAVFTTVASSAGGVLPSANAAAVTCVVNAGANTLTIYPATGQQLNNLSANLGVQIAAGKTALFVPSVNRWGVVLGA